MADSGSEEKRIDVTSVFEVCETCGYTGGFHLLVERLNSEGKVKLRLKCPNCGQVYDVGLAATVEPIAPE